MDDRDAAAAKEDLRARDRLRYQWMLESITKFRLFFPGLVFAMLAFSIQFPIGTASPPVKWSQAVAWVLLLVAGCLAIRDAGGFVTKYVEATAVGLSPTARGSMWVCFVVGVALLAVARLAGG